MAAKTIEQNVADHHCRHKRGVEPKNIITLSVGQKVSARSIELYVVRSNWNYGF